MDEFKLKLLYWWLERKNAISLNIQRLPRFALIRVPKFILYFLKCCYLLFAECFSMMIEGVKSSIPHYTTWENAQAQYKKDHGTFEEKKEPFTITVEEELEEGEFLIKEDKGGLSKNLPKPPLEWFMIMLKRMLHPKYIKDKDGNVIVPDKLYYRDPEFQWAWEIGVISRFTILFSFIIVFGEGLNNKVNNDRVDYRLAPAVEFYSDLTIACASSGFEILDFGMVLNGSVKNKLQNKYLYTHYLDYNKYLFLPFYPIRDDFSKKKVLKYCEENSIMFDDLPRVIDRDKCIVEKYVPKEYETFGELLSSRLGKLVNEKNKKEVSSSLDSEWRKWLLTNKTFLSRLSYKCYPSKYNSEDRVVIKITRNAPVATYDKRQFFSYDRTRAVNSSIDSLIEEVRE